MCVRVSKTLPGFVLLVHHTHVRSKIDYKATDKCVHFVVVVVVVVVQQVHFCQDLRIC